MRTTRPLVHALAQRAGSLNDFDIGKAGRNCGHSSKGHHNVTAQIVLIEIAFSGDRNILETVEVAIVTPSSVILRLSGPENRLRKPPLIVSE